MSTGNCMIPGNPDIAGVGVRIAIYVQNLLCFFPAFWALVDGKVSQGELDAAETQATTNLVLAFAILISSIVQAQTLGLTNYHASIVLNMSWMNNTNAFIYFLLYIHHKSQADVLGRVEPTWRAWVRHVRELAVSIVNPRTANSNPGVAGSDPEFGQPNGVGSSGVKLIQTGDVQGNDDYARTGAKLLVKRFVLLLGSLHLSLMAGLGLWLWSNIRTFGEGEDDVNDCAATHALLAILGKHVPFSSEVLRIISLAIYSIFLVPGVNLLLPIAVFLWFYHLHRVAPTPKDPGSGMTPDSLQAKRHLRFRVWIRRAYSSIVRSWGALPPFIGLIFLLVINLVFIVDIELTLKHNAHLQGNDEAEWGFGQILAMLLLFMPLRDLAETLLARRIKQRQKDLDMGLGGAIKAKDLNMVRAMLSRGASPNTKVEGEISAMQMACNLEALDVIRVLLEVGADPNIEDENKTPCKVDSDNKNSLRLLNQVEKGSLDPVEALVQAAKNGYGAAIKVFLGFLEIKLDEKATFLESLSVGSSVNAGNTDGPHGPDGPVRDRIASPTAAVTKAQEFETVILKLLLAAPGIDVNATNSIGRTPLSCLASNGHEAIVKLLLAAPAIDINTPDTDGMTPLHYAAESSHEAIVKLLLAVPEVDVNASNTGGWRPLSFAAKNDHEAVVKLLLAAPDIDVNAADTDGWTPLRFAAEGGHEAMVKLLLAAPGIDVNAPATDGRTPLSFSAWDGHDAIVKLLLAVPGIDVNAADTSGWAAITWAAFNGKEAVIKALCAVPEIIVDVAEVKRHLEDPPEGWQRKYSRRRPRKSIDEQDKCVRLLEQFVESKGGEA